MTGVRRAFGAWGEQTAEAYLRGLGMVVIDRNWRCPQGELDLVALDGDVIVFCEQNFKIYVKPTSRMTRQVTTAPPDRAPLAAARS